MGKDDDIQKNGTAIDAERTEVSIRPVRNGYVVKSKYGWFCEATRELAVKRAIELLPPISTGNVGTSR